MTKREEMVKLSWDILKYKYHYYEKSKPLITDYQYDMIEKKYEALCEELGQPPTACDMVGFDWNRRCCQMVACKEEGFNFNYFERFGYSKRPETKKSKKKKKKS